MNTLSNSSDHMEPLLAEAQKYFDAYEMSCPKQYREIEAKRRKMVQERVKTTPLPSEASKSALWRAIAAIPPEQVMKSDYDFLFGHLWLIPDEVGALVFVDPVFSTDFASQFAKMFERGIIDESFLNELHDFLVLASAHTVILEHQIRKFLSELLWDYDTPERKVFLDKLLGPEGLSSYCELREALELIRDDVLWILKTDHEVEESVVEQFDASQGGEQMSLVDAFNKLNENRDRLRKKSDLDFYKDDLYKAFRSLLTVPSEYLSGQIRERLNEVSVKLQRVDDTNLPGLLDEMDGDKEITNFFYGMNSNVLQKGLKHCLLERRELNVGLMIDECLERKLNREKRRQGWVDLS